METIAPLVQTLLLAYEYQRGETERGPLVESYNSIGYEGAPQTDQSLLAASESLGINADILANMYDAPVNTIASPARSSNQQSQSRELVFSLPTQATPENIEDLQTRRETNFGPIQTYAEPYDENGIGLGVIYDSLSVGQEVEAELIDQISIRLRSLIRRNQQHIHIFDANVYRNRMGQNITIDWNIGKLKSFQYV